jgi:hypothetical protein
VEPAMAGVERSWRPQGEATGTGGENPSAGAAPPDVRRDGGGWRRRARGLMASQGIPSWNQILDWLPNMDLLRQTA